MHLRLLSATSVCAFAFGLIGCGGGEPEKRISEATPVAVGVPGRLPTEPHEEPVARREKPAARPAGKRGLQAKQGPSIDYYRSAPGFGSGAPPFDPHGRFFVLGNGESREMDALTLPELHELSVIYFTSSPGMGIGRDLIARTLPKLLIELLYGSEIEQPAPESRRSEHRTKYEAKLETLTLPDGTRRIVREVGWELKNQQLVSVDTESGPAAYLQDAVTVHTNKRSKTATGANTPKRKLDGFETEALERLRKGEDLAVQTTSETMRMLGAIRSGLWCSHCHKVPCGTLLGAFTYELRAKPEAAEGNGDAGRAK